MYIAKKVGFQFSVYVSIGITKQKTINALTRAIERTMNEVMDCAIRVVIKPSALEYAQWMRNSGIHFKVTWPREQLLSVELLRRKIPQSERDGIETLGIGI